jgi:hypothetical protein
LTCALADVHRIIFCFAELPFARARSRNARRFWIRRLTAFRWRSRTLLTS